MEAHVWVATKEFLLWLFVLSPAVRKKCCHLMLLITLKNRILFNCCTALHKFTNSFFPRETWLDAWIVFLNGQIHFLMACGDCLIKNVTFHVMTRSKILDMAGSNIPDMTGRKLRRRRRRRKTQTIANRYTIQASTKKKPMF